MRVLVLFLRYGTEKYGDALNELDNLYAAQAPDIERHTIIIDNSIMKGFIEEYAGDRYLIGGDNSRREFSGWQCALDLMGAELRKIDAIHFVTSAFRMLYTDYLDRFSTRIVEVVSRRPTCVGHIDYYPHPVRFDAHVFRHWVRTSFFLVNPVELMRLRNIVSIQVSEGLFSDDPEWPFAKNRRLSPGYEELMYNWLASDKGTGQGTSWHSRLDPSQDCDRLEFQQKALSILNEHLLSVRLRAQGTNVVDITYLAELLETNSGLLVQFPNWTEQLRRRGIPGHSDIGNLPVR